MINRDCSSEGAEKHILGYHSLIRFLFSKTYQKL